MYVELGLHDDEEYYIIFSRSYLTSPDGVVGASLVNTVKVVDFWDFLDQRALEAAYRVVKSILDERGKKIPLVNPEDPVSLYEIDDAIANILLRAFDVLTERVWWELAKDCSDGRKLLDEIQAKIVECSLERS